MKKGKKESRENVQASSTYSKSFNSRGKFYKPKKCSCVTTKLIIPFLVKKIRRITTNLKIEFQVFTKNLTK